MSGMAHFFMSVGGSKFHERLAHFFIDIYNTAFVIYGGGKMKPIELFYLLSNVKDRDKFIEILRANRIKPCRSKTKKKTT